MITIRRKRGEEVHFALEDGRSFVLKVLDTGANTQVLLGIDFPPNVKVLRMELVEKQDEPQPTTVP